MNHFLSLLSGICQVIEIRYVLDYRLIHMGLLQSETDTYAE